MRQQVIDQSMNQPIHPSINRHGVLGASKSLPYLGGLLDPLGEQHQPIVLVHEIRRDQVPESLRLEDANHGQNAKHHTAACCHDYSGENTERRVHVPLNTATTGMYKVVSSPVSQ